MPYDHRIRNMFSMIKYGYSMTCANLVFYDNCGITVEVS